MTAGASSSLGSNKTRRNFFLYFFDARSPCLKQGYCIRSLVGRMNKEKYDDKSPLRSRQHDQMKNDG